MRHSLLFLSATLLMLSACGGRQEGGTATADAEGGDTLTVDTDATYMPEGADELFDDFIFNFAGSPRLQSERIHFPLPVAEGGHTSTVSKEQWQTENFFMRQGFYTLLFDSEQHAEIVKDTTVRHAIVEKIFLDKQLIRQYVFDREQGRWMLVRIQTMPLAEAPNATFLNFYRQFATDKDFQLHHLATTVWFVGPDPDDDFRQMEGIITRDTWEAFAPELPTSMIYNIIYGEPSVEGNQMLFIMRGISNGLEMEMTFKRRSGRWTLTKLTT